MAGEGEDQVGMVMRFVAIDADQPGLLGKILDDIAGDVIGCLGIGEADRAEDLPHHQIMLHQERSKMAEIEPADRQLAIERVLLAVPEIPDRDQTVAEFRRRLGGYPGRHDTPLYRFFGDDNLPWGSTRTAGRKPRRVGGPKHAAARLATAPCTRAYDEARCRASIDALSRPP